MKATILITSAQQASEPPGVIVFATAAISEGPRAEVQFNHRLVGETPSEIHEELREEFRTVYREQTDITFEGSIVLLNSVTVL